jgi:CheY-like chemotaxis protein
LAFSRRQELEPKVLDANEFVTNMENILRRTLGNHIKIQTNLATNLGRIKADPAQLESAILNLAINARDAMPEGGQLLIETSNETFDAAYAERYADAQPGPHVCISVTDSGTGIPADKIKSIFQPFFTTKEVGKGTGLGLSMVFGFVRQSGGHINVYSEVGQGTRFRLCLPHTDDQPARAGNNSFPDAPLQTGSGIILLIEDEAQVRETTALLLEDLGYTVIAAADGPSALQSLEVQPDVDLLFTDMVMPGGMNGHQLAEAVHQRLPDLPVLLTSGYPRDAFAEGRKFPLLNKPYTNQGLAQAIHLALDTKQSQEETQ